MNTLMATESKGSQFIKLLGVYVSNDLKWTHHVDSTLLKREVRGMTLHMRENYERGGTNVTPYEQYYWFETLATHGVYIDRYINSESSSESFGVLQNTPCRLEGGVRVCGDSVLRYFWCGFAVIFILTRSIAVSKH